MAEAALECRGLTVRYGEVAALTSVDAVFEKAQIHAIVGPSGAGKTTFARVCAGIVKPYHGSVHVNGRDLPMGSVGAARAAGVEIVHQNFALPPSFTIAEVMEFGAAHPGLKAYSRRGLEARWREHLKRTGVSAPPGARVRAGPGWRARVRRPGC